MFRFGGLAFGGLYFGDLYFGGLYFEGLDLGRCFPFNLFCIVSVRANVYLNVVYFKYI